MATESAESGESGDTAHDMHGETQATTARGSEQIRFLSDEICIVVATKPGVDAYGAVRGHLNTLLRLPPAPATTADASTPRYDLRRTAPGTHTLVPVGHEVRGFARDLTLSAAALKGLPTDEEALRAFDTPDAGTVTLDATHEQQGLSTTAIYRYKVGPEPDSVAARHARAHSVRELVQLLNHRVGARPLGRDPQGDNWQINAATPNWLAVIAQGGPTSPCPGTPPEPIEDDGEESPPPPRNWTFQKDGTDGNAAADAGKIVVAVLDSCPDTPQVTAAAARFKAPDGQPPNLWNRVVDPANPLHIEESIGDTADGLGRLQAIIPDHRGALAPWHETHGDDHLAALAHTHYAMPDHGLFVAGIVKDIAPGAEVHLIRVMSETGIGDLFTLNRVLFAVAQRYAQPGKKLIINLSLTVAVPPNDQMVGEWHPEASQSLDEMRHHVTDLTAALNRTHHSLRVMMDWLATQDILVVAAAGNDSYPEEAGDQRHEPSLPARYTDVLSVAAMAGSKQPATYSNQGAEAVFTNGVATWGGDAAMDGDGTLRIASSDGKRDGVAGLFSAATLPAISDEHGTQPLPNTTGWVYWAGTSFATPIITGIAANLWAADPSLPIAAVRQAIIARASADEHEAGELDCDGIVMAQAQQFYPV